MGRRPSHVGENEAFGEAVQWAVSGDNYRLSGMVAQALPPGVYDCRDDGWGNAQLCKIEPKLDELITFPDTLYSQVTDRINKFWTRRSIYHEYGFLHKMGLLLWGVAGSGKSSLLYQVMNNIINDGHLCLLCQNRVDYFIDSVEAVRKVEPDRPMVCMIEDIDTHLARGSENELLQWLDGSNKTDHVVVIGTTNYPEKLDKRIVCRPRRFDRVLYVGVPTYGMRETYFSNKLKNADADVVKRWTDVSEGLTFAGLAELVISVQCMDNDLEETAQLLIKQEGHKPKSTDFDLLARSDDEDDEDAEDMVVDSPNPLYKLKPPFDDIGGTGKENKCETIKN